MKLQDRLTTSSKRKNLKRFCSLWDIFSFVVNANSRWMFPVFRSLWVDEDVPAADLLAPYLSHVVPVGQLLLARTVQTQWEPADHLLALHRAFVVDGDHQRHVRQLKQSHLNTEQKSFFQVPLKYSLPIHATSKDRYSFLVRPAGKHLFRDPTSH